MEKDLSIIQERKNRIHLTCDQVSGWSSKVTGKLTNQLQEREGTPQTNSQFE
jgi:hypothetical protein